MNTNEIINQVVEKSSTGFFAKIIYGIRDFYLLYMQEPLLNSLKDYGEIIKSLFIILIVVALSWVIGKLVQFVIKLLLRIIHFDDFSDRIGFTRFLEHGGLHNIPSTTIANIFYWIILFIGFTVGIGITSEVLAVDNVRKLFNFIPEALLGILIVMLGMAVGVFLSKILRIALIRAGLQEKIVLMFQSLLLLFFALKSLYIGLTVVGISMQKIQNYKLIEQIFQNVITYTFLGLAIAFGLAGRHLASDILASFKLKKLYPKGSEVEYDDVKGVLKEIGWFDSLIYTEEGIINIPNSLLARKIIKRKI